MPETDDLDKKYYRIREVADLVGVPQSTLRFWEKQFTLIRPRRNAGGTRYYTPADIEVIRMIHYLVKDKGLKLDAAEAQIRANRTGVTRRYEAVARLRQIRQQLNELLASLSSKRH